MLLRPEIKWMPTVGRSRRLETTVIRKNLNSPMRTERIPDSLCDRTVKWISRVRLKKGSLLRVSGRKIGVRSCTLPFFFQRNEFLID